MRYKRVLDISNIINPFYLGLLAGIISIAFTLFPTDIYKFYISEPNFMFSSSKTRLWILLCTMLFCSSVFLSSHIFKHVKFVNSDGSISYIHQKTANIIVIFLVVFYFVRIIAFNTSIGIGNIINTLANGGNGGIKDQISQQLSESKLGWITDFSVPLILYVFWVALTQKNKRNMLVFSVIFLLNSFTSALTLTRTQIIYSIVMLFVVFVMSRKDTSNAGYIKIFSALFGVLLAFVSVFTVLGNSRSYSDQFTPQERTISNLVDYFPASYNRLAAVIEGKIVYPNSDSGYYTSQFLWELPIVAKVFHFVEIGRNVGLDLPDSSFVNWESQFSVQNSAGLKYTLIWPTSFGYVWSDYGWLGGIYFIITGLISGFFFAYARSRSVIAVCVLPLIVCSIFNTFSVPMLSQSLVFFHIIGTVFILMILKFFRSKKQL